ncbi:MAG: universal stress protein [Bacteroidetes bacterium]|nr:universal stress protein [Bacteroidota bacterium]MBU1718028.1 universal stress protein [Bacteroidota bacterium]
MEENYFNILVPVDFSEQSLIALQQAQTFAKLLNLGIHLLYVEEKAGFSFGNFIRSHKKYLDDNEAKERLHAISDDFKKQGIVSSVLIREGKVYTHVIELAKEMESKFIFMGTNSCPSKNEKQYVGSNTLKVTRHAKCPIFTLTGHKTFETLKTIVLPIDLSKETREKVTVAIPLAKIAGATIKVVSFFAHKKDREKSNKLKRQMAHIKEFIEKRDIPCTAEIITIKNSGDDRKMLQEYLKSNNADLVAIMVQQYADVFEFNAETPTKRFVKSTEIPVLCVPAKATTNLSVKPL